MGKSVSYLSDEATQAANTANELTPILSISPPDGTFWQFHNRVPQGSSVGLPIIMDLDTSAPADLSTDTTFILRVERPEDDVPTAVSVAEYNIAAWNELSLSEQRDVDNIDSIKVELKQQHVNVRDSDTLTVEVDSADVVSWSDSQLYFAREGVDEMPLDG